MSNVYLSLAVCGLCVAVSQAQGDDDPVKKKLTLAKAKFAEAASQFPVEIAAWFEKEDKRIRGLSKGLVELLEKLKNEKAAFDKNGVLPSGLPSSIRKKRANSLDEMVKAYDTAITDYFKNRRDDDAETMKREKGEFLLYSAGPQERATAMIVGQWGLPGLTMIFEKGGVVTQLNPKGQLHAKGRWNAREDGKVAYDLDNGWKAQVELRGKDSIQCLGIGPMREQWTAEGTRLKK